MGEAVAAGWKCVAQYVPEGSDAAVAGAGPVNQLAPGVFERVASAETPQPPLALVQMRRDRADVGALVAAASFVVALDRISDPGNLGTVLRSAEAAGAELVVLTPGSVDPYNPKVIRASAGAIFHVPVVTATLDELADGGLRLVGTSSHATTGRTVVPYTGCDWSGRVAIALGNEAAGLPDDWTDDVGPIREWVTIPHAGRSESLNVAMAATVLAFDVARQRHRRGQTPDAT